MGPTTNAVGIPASPAAVMYAFSVLFARSEDVMQVTSLTFYQTDHYPLEVKE